MEREKLLERKKALEAAIGGISGDKEALGRVLGQLGRINMELNEEKEALITLIASQLLLTSIDIPEKIIVEGWISALREQMGYERFMECFHKALPLAGSLLVQYLGIQEAERCIEDFLKIKGNE